MGYWSVGVLEFSFSITPIQDMNNHTALPIEAAL
jgi:hypothetical protein